QGTQAKGQLTFYNSAFVTQSIVAGTLITGADGVQVVTDAVAQIPADDPNSGIIGSIAVPAHTVNVGAKGNIVSLDINKTCCLSNPVTVKNLSAFTGGQDAQSYRFPTQDDVDQVSQSVQANLEQKARQQLQSQLASGEQLAASPTCQFQATPDHPVGAHGMDVPRVTVAVASTCQAEAYASTRLQQQITLRLQARATEQLGPGYKQVDAPQIRIASQPASSVNALPALNIVASGIWMYTFGATQVHEMLLSIVSKNRAQASMLLKQARGVAEVTIKGGGDPLPSEIGRIHIIYNNNR
ncbi:MAG TPA: hypothetical protein VL485_30340, partial [Ktedonobacteraceae bacterium]|nr:hypothetical protein [Ktedonobacteraceae bacterium]